MKKLSLSSDKVIREVFDFLSNGRNIYPYTKNTVICDTRIVGTDDGYYCKLLHRKAIVIGDYLVTHGLGMSEGIDPISSSIEAIRIPAGLCPRDFIRDPENSPKLSNVILFDYKNQICVSHLRNEDINYVIVPSMDRIIYNPGENELKLYPTKVRNIEAKLNIVRNISIALEIMLSMR